MLAPYDAHRTLQHDIKEDWATASGLINESMPDAVPVLMISLSGPPVVSTGAMVRKAETSAISTTVHPKNRRRDWYSLAVLCYQSTGRTARRTGCILAAFGRAMMAFPFELMERK